MSNSSAVPHDECCGVQRMNNKKTESKKKKNIATLASYPNLSTHPNQFSVSQFISHLNGSPRTGWAITLLLGSLWCERRKLLSVLTDQIDVLICWIDMWHRAQMSHLKDLKPAVWRRSLDGQTPTTLTQKRWKFIRITSLTKLMK